METKLTETERSHEQETSHLTAEIETLRERLLEVTQQMEEFRRVSGGDVELDIVDIVTIVNTSVAQYFLDQPVYLLAQNVHGIIYIVYIYIYI